MGVQPVRIRLEPSGRVLEIPVSPDTTIDNFKDLLIQKYGINNPVIQVKRNGYTLTTPPPDVRIKDLPADAELVVSTNIDVGAW